MLPLAQLQLGEADPVCSICHEQEQDLQVCSAFALQVWLFKALAPQDLLDGNVCNALCIWVKGGKIFQGIHHSMKGCWPPLTTPVAQEECASCQFCPPGFCLVTLPSYRGLPMLCFAEKSASQFKALEPGLQMALPSSSTDAAFRRAIMACEWLSMPWKSMMVSGVALSEPAETFRLLGC